MLSISSMSLLHIFGWNFLIAQHEAKTFYIFVYPVAALIVNSAIEIDTF